MDEFGVLVESIGFRAQGKSAPMAKSKPKPKSQFTTHSNTTAKTSSFEDPFSLPVDQLDGVFRSNAAVGRTSQPQNVFVDDDIFGGPVSNSQQFGGFDLETVLSGSNARKNNTSHSGSTSSVGFDAYDDLLGSKSNTHSTGVDDLFGSLGLNSNAKPEKKGPGFDELMSTFGEASASNTKY